MTMVPTSREDVLLMGVGELGNAKKRRLQKRRRGKRREKIWEKIMVESGLKEILVDMSGPEP